MGYTGDKKRDYQNNWLKNKRQRWIDEQGPCVKCGSYDRLEIDHIDPATKDPELRERGTIMWSWTIEKREAELAKCQILCHDCHWEKTKLQTYGERQHGEERTYRHGCRCQPCREANTEKARDYKRRKREEHDAIWLSF